MNYIFALLLTVSPITAPDPVIIDNVYDYPGIATQPLLEVFTVEELAGAGETAVNWAAGEPAYGAMVPYFPDNFPECEGHQRCILINHTWYESTRDWRNDRGDDVRRVMLAHEFAHVLSVERKETDKAYAKAVDRVHEECLADAVATLVLERGGWPPSHTEDYTIAYSCEEFWMKNWGESRADEAAGLAASLLDWAIHRWDPIPEPANGETGTISGPATATQGAVRVPDGSIVIDVGRPGS